MYDKLEIDNRLTNSSAIAVLGVDVSDSTVDVEGGAVVDVAGNKWNPSSRSCTNVFSRISCITKPTLFKADVPEVAPVPAIEAFFSVVCLFLPMNKLDAALNRLIEGI